MTHPSANPTYAAIAVQKAVWLFCGKAMKKNEINARTARNSVTTKMIRVGAFSLGMFASRLGKQKVITFLSSPAHALAPTISITLSGNAASTPSTTFSNQTYQVRVNQAASHRRRCAKAVGNTDAYVANAPAEYFADNPGQQAAFISTSTSTGYCRNDVTRLWKKPIR